MKKQKESKKKTVIIKITKEYIGRKLISRWKTTTTEWMDENNTYSYTKQDKNNFQSLSFSL